MRAVAFVALAGCRLGFDDVLPADPGNNDRAVPTACFSAQPALGITGSNDLGAAMTPDGVVVVWTASGGSVVSGAVIDQQGNVALDAGVIKNVSQTQPSVTFTGGAIVMGGIQGADVKTDVLRPDLTFLAGDAGCPVGS